MASADPDDRWLPWPEGVEDFTLIDTRLECPLEDLALLLYGGSNSFFHERTAAFDMRDGETTAWHASPEAADEASFVPSGEVVSGAHLPVSVGHARVERGRGTSMGKTFTSVERMRVVGRERGRLLVLESCVTADVTYGSTFHPLVRVELSADEAGGTRLRARGSVAFVKPVNGFIKGMVRRGARDGMLKGYAKMRTLLDRAIERMAHQRLGEGEGEEERQKEAEAAERTAQAQEAAAAAAAQEAAAAETLRVPSAAAAAAETLPPIPLAALLGRPLAQLAWALSAPLQALDGRRGAGARAAGPGRAAARARAATASALGASALLLALQVAVAASAAAAGPRAPGPARALAAWAELPASPRAAVAGAAVAAVGRALANVVALGLPRLARSLRRAAGGPPRALVRARERRAAKARAKAARAAQAAEEAAAAAAAAAHAAAAAVSSAAEAASLAAEAEAQAGAAAIADDDEAAPAVRFEGYAEAMARAAREADAAAEAASLAASGGRAEARELEGAPKSAASIFAGNWTAMWSGGDAQSAADGAKEGDSFDLWGFFTGWAGGEGGGGGEDAKRPSADADGKGSPLAEGAEGAEAAPGALGSARGTQALAPAGSKGAAGSAAAAALAPPAPAVPAPAPAPPPPKPRRVVGAAVTFEEALMSPDRTARSLWSGGALGRREASLAVIEEIFENERLQPFRGWGHSWPGHFLPTDRFAHWSARDIEDAGKHDDRAAGGAGSAENADGKRRAADQGGKGGKDAGGDAKSVRDADRSDKAGKEEAIRDGDERAKAAADKSPLLLSPHPAAPARSQTADAAPAHRGALARSASLGLPAPDAPIAVGATSIPGAPHAPLSSRVLSAPTSPTRGRGALRGCADAPTSPSPERARTQGPGGRFGRSPPPLLDLTETRGSRREGDGSGRVEAPACNDAGDAAAQDAAAPPSEAGQDAATRPSEAGKDAAARPSEAGQVSSGSSAESSAGSEGPSGSPRPLERQEAMGPAAPPPHGSAALPARTPPSASAAPADASPASVATPPIWRRATTSQSFTEVVPRLPPGWRWVEDTWHLDLSGRLVDAVDEVGWAYGFDFGNVVFPFRPGGGNKGFADFVRRRRWIRIRVPILPGWEQKEPASKGTKGARGDAAEAAGTAESAGAGHDMPADSSLAARVARNAVRGALAAASAPRDASPRSLARRVVARALDAAVLASLGPEEREARVAARELVSSAIAAALLRAETGTAQTPGAEGSTTASPAAATLSSSATSGHHLPHSSAASSHAILHSSSAASGHPPPSSFPPQSLNAASARVTSPVRSTPAPAPALASHRHRGGYRGHAPQPQAMELSLSPVDSGNLIAGPAPGSRSRRRARGGEVAGRGADSDASDRAGSSAQPRGSAPGSRSPSPCAARGLPPASPFPPPLRSASPRREAARSPPPGALSPLGSPARATLAESAPVASLFAAAAAGAGPGGVGDVGRFGRGGARGRSQGAAPRRGGARAGREPLSRETSLVSALVASAEADGAHLSLSVSGRRGGAELGAGSLSRAGSGLGSSGASSPPTGTAPAWSSPAGSSPLAGSAPFVGAALSAPDPTSFAASASAPVSLGVSPTASGSLPSFTDLVARRGGAEIAQADDGLSLRRFGAPSAEGGDDEEARCGSPSGARVSAPLRVSLLVEEDGADGDGPGGRPAVRLVLSTGDERTGIGRVAAERDGCAAAAEAGAEAPAVFSGSADAPTVSPRSARAEHSAAAPALATISPQISESSSDALAGALSMDGIPGIGALPRGSGASLASSASSAALGESRPAPFGAASGPAAPGEPRLVADAVPVALPSGDIEPAPGAAPAALLAAKPISPPARPPLSPAVGSPPGGSVAASVGPVVARPFSPTGAQHAGKTAPAAAPSAGSQHARGGSPSFFGAGALAALGLGSIVGGGGSSGGSSRGEQAAAPAASFVPFARAAPFSSASAPRPAPSGAPAPRPSTLSPPPSATSPPATGGAKHPVRRTSSAMAMLEARGGQLSEQDRMALLLQAALELATDEGLAGRKEKRDARPKAALDATEEGDQPKAALDTTEEGDQQPKAASEEGDQPKTVRDAREEGDGRNSVANACDGVNEEEREGASDAAPPPVDAKADARDAPDGLPADAAIDSAPVEATTNAPLDDDFPPLAGETPAADALRAALSALSPASPTSEASPDSPASPTSSLPSRVESKPHECQT